MTEFYRAGYIWPEVFITGKVEYADTREGLGAAIADASMAWGLVMDGAERPELFGTVMAKIANFLGVSGTSEGIAKAAQDWLASE